MKHWNNKKLTALVCTSLMTGALLPCGMASAADVVVDEVGKLPKGAKSVDNGNGIALEKAEDTLVLNFDGTWNNNFFCGGYGDAGTAVDGYHVIFNKGTTEGYVFGAESTVGDVLNNELVIGAAAVANNHVYGARSQAKDAKGNKVTMRGGTAKRDLYGGQAWNDTGCAENNAVEMMNGTVAGCVFGGYARGKNATSNTVTMSGGTVKTNVYGGYSGAAGSVTNNTVTMNDGTVEQHVYGGLTERGKAEKNTFTMSGGIVKLDIHGGESRYGIATNNTAIISGDSIIERSAYGAYSWYGTVTNNTVAMSDGTVEQHVYGALTEQGNAEKNTFMMSGGIVKLDIHGGESWNGIVTNNIAMISGNSRIERDAYGAYSKNGTVTNNTIVMSDGTVNGSVVGGYAGKPATGNTVIMSGGTVGRDLKGGHSNVAATNNVVNLVGFGGTLDGAVSNTKKPIVNGTVYGGFSNSGKDAKTGNQLNIYGTGTQVGNIMNFEKIQFHAPASESEESMLEARYRVNLENSQVVLNQDPGYDMLLLHSDGGIDKGTAKFFLNGTEMGLSDWQLTQDTGFLKATLDAGFAFLHENRDLVWNSTDYKVYAGSFTGEDGIEKLPLSGQSVVSLAAVLADDPNFAGTVYGACDAREGKFGTGGTVEIAGDNASKISLIGGDGDAPASNTLNVKGSDAKAKSIEKFDSINFTDAKVDETMLAVERADIGNAKVSLDSRPVGDDYVTLLHSDTEIERSKGTTFWLGSEQKRLSEIDPNVDVKESYIRATKKAGFDITYDDKELIWDNMEKDFYTGQITGLGDPILPASQKPVADLAVIMEENPDYSGAVYGSYDVWEDVSDLGGTVEINKSVDASKVALLGSNVEESGNNTLQVAVGGAKAKSIAKFDNINFSNFSNTGMVGAMLGVEDADITGAKISLDALPANDMTFLQSSNDIQADGTEKYYINKVDVTGRLIGTATNQGNYVLVEQGQLGLSDDQKEIAWNHHKSAFVAGTHTDAWGKAVSATNSTVSLAAAPEGINTIYGSYTEDGSSATGGTIDLRTQMNLSGIDLIGGYAYGGAVGTNTLNVRAVGTSVHNLSDFSDVNFYVPASAVSGDVMLTCTDTENKTSLKGTAVHTSMESVAQLKNGGRFVLLKNEAKGIAKDAATKLDGKLEVGGWMEYDAEVAMENGNKELVLTLNKYMQQERPNRLTESSKTFAETRAAEISLLNNAADMVTRQGLQNAVAAAEADEDSITAKNGGSFAPFAALAAASMRYETGSYVDSKGWGINVGMSRRIHQKDGKTLIAPFLEYGKASYDSYLDNGVHGDGTNQYFGVGVLARKDLNTGLYYEGSARLGWMKGDYEGLDKYDTKSMYYALHAGIGKVVPIDDESSMDYYGKLFYTHQNSDSVDLQKQYGETMDFDAINSFRMRLGVRYNHDVSCDSTFYAGLAWDYEFGSEARASYRGLSTPTPSMKGSSGLLEIGWKRPISEKNPVAIDVNLTGYAGKQRGISANVGFNWAF